MPVKYSVVIPTFNNLENCLRPCCESIIENTDFSEVEIIVLGNGCTDGTREYVHALMDDEIGHFRYWGYPEALGYARATNAGIKMAQGEYIVLLNNDTLILKSENKNRWLQILEEPFKIVENCGLTGPIKTFSPHINSEFLIFFCVMISRKVFEKIGMLSEFFQVGGGEDLDFCMRAKARGFSIEMAPYQMPTGMHEGRVSGGFPIYHDGEATVKHIPGWQQIFDKNMKMLEDIYLNNKPGVVA